MVQSLDSGLLLPDGVSLKKLETAQILDTTTKVKERDQRYRKSLILLRKFFNRVVRWQKERPALLTSNRDLELLRVLFLGEVAEVLELRELEGLPNYDFKLEKGETIDVGFFLASLTFYLNKQQGQFVDFDKVVHTANGQSNSSSAIDNLMKVSGNLTEKSLHKDLEHLWILWVSYLIHMKYPVNPNQVLTEYTFPKNNGNYIAELLSRNPLFENKFGREMDEDEEKTYFAHYRKATRLIRDFIIKYIDPGVEHTGLAPEHYEPYKLFIYSFINFPDVGLNPQRALEMLEFQLYEDFDIDFELETSILETSIIDVFKQTFGRDICKVEINKHADHLQRSAELIKNVIGLKSLEHVSTQLKSKLYSEYNQLIYYFMYFKDIHSSSKEVLKVLKTKLYKDFNVLSELDGASNNFKILQPNTKLPN